jgi:hypothetical protein
MTALENRQEAILAQLADLKNQITVLRAQLKQSAAPPVAKGTNIAMSKTCSTLQVQNCNVFMLIKGIGIICMC